MAFSDLEKENIREKLMTNCEKSWSKYGYKKTNIEDLCYKSGISKGAFYLFYSSKEELFCDVMIHVQKRLVDLTKEKLGIKPTKQNLSEAFQMLFREYNKLPFIMETQTPDFITFMNKLSTDKIKELEEHGQFDIQKLIQNSGLIFQIEEKKALTLLVLIFRPLPYDETFPFDPFEATDFMIDTLINKIFK